MTVSISRFMAIVLMVLLFPIVRVIRLVQLLLGYRKPVYAGTIEADPLEYSGDNPVVIAVWAGWASVWTAATADVMEQLK